MQKTVAQEEDRTLFDVADDETSVELVPAEEATAALRAHGEEPMMMALARMDQGLQVLERAHQVLATIRRNALRLTGPADWVAMKGKGAPDEAAFCMLTSSGARRIAPFFGILLDAAQPTDSQGAFAPRMERGDDGEIQLHGWLTATCRLTGETIRVSGSRSSTEDFTGRTQANTGASPLVEKADLARALETLLHTSAVRKLAGMGKVPFQELADAGIKTDAIPRGSGFGTASERGATAVASQDVIADRDKLRDEILRRVGGDKGAARDLLKDITSNPPKFGGFMSIEKLAQDWQVKNAWAKLRSHEVFGDKAQGGNGGAA